MKCMKLWNKCALGLAVLLAPLLVSPLYTAHAAVGGGELAFPAGKDGQTAVGVQVTRADIGTLSCEVPLSIPLVVKEDEGTRRVLCPDNYYIQNNSPALPDGTETAVAVTQVEVSAVAGSSWTLTDNPTQANELSLSIGGFPLPNPVGGSVVKETKGTDSAFWSQDTGKYVQLVGDDSKLELPIVGAVAEVEGTGSASPSAQFQLTYTISLLDTSGNPIGSFVEPSPAPAP